MSPEGIGPYTGKYPRDLVYPEHNNFSPRIGIAVRAMKDTVVRAGYGINYAVGQYAKFIQDFAFQPPYADVQTNETTAGARDQLWPTAFPRRKPKATTRSTSTTGFLTCRCGTSICSARCPWALCSISVTTAPKALAWTLSMRQAAPPTASLSGVFYDYEDSVAFSNYNALTLSARKRLQRGIAMGATYTYSHSIDNASSIGGNGGTATVVAQNWQNLLAEESNSSFDIRHQVTGNFLYELPFGPDAHWHHHRVDGAFAQRHIRFRHLSFRQRRSADAAL